MIIGIAGTRYNKRRLGEGSGKTTLAIAMMYHLLKDEYKAKISFEAYKLSFKFKRLRESYTPDMYIVPCVLVSDDIIVKEMLQPLLKCKEQDLYDKDYLVRPIKEIKSNIIYLNGIKQRSIADKSKATRYVNNRNILTPIGSNNVWSVKYKHPSPLTMLQDLKNSLYTNIHHSIILLTALKFYGKSTVIFYPSLENFSTFKLIKQYGGATIHIDNPNKKGNHKPHIKEATFLKNEFDYDVINNLDVENIFREASVIIKDLLNGV